VGVSAPDVAELAGVVSGPVLTPRDDGYLRECAVYNLNLRLEPAVVVGATAVADVLAAVRFAARHGLPVAVKNSGHQTARPARDAVLITTGRMAGCDVDARRRTVRVAAGARWPAVLAAAARHGLAPISGSSPTAGVVGYLLGGGQSPVLSRSLGYAADHIVGIEIVTAGGELRQVTETDEPDLFWALRGGKGNFGVVTAVEFDLFPVTRLYGGGLYFAGEHLDAVLHTWRDWLRDLPEETTTSVAVQRLPPLPELPGPLRGAFVVHLRFAHLGSVPEGEALLAPMRGCAPVLLDAVAEMDYADVAGIHRDPPEPMPYYDRTTSLREFSAETAAAFIDVTGPDSGCPLATVEIRPMGGALNREPRVPNAVPTRGVAFVLFGFGVGPPEQADALRGHLDLVVRRLEPWSDDHLMVNFLSADEGVGAAAVRSLYGAERYRRLADVKARYDPTNMFRMNHNIEPTDPTDR
jgi:FAD/FMN-containing dehydrogenase